MGIRQTPSARIMNKLKQQIDVSKIFVVDDFMPHWLATSLENQVKNYDGWIINEVPSEFLTDGKKSVDVGMTRLLYEQNRVDWEDANGITKLLHDASCLNGIVRVMPDALIQGLHRVRLNCTFSDINQHPHIDSDYPGMWTIVYFLNDSDGGTKFYHDNGYDLATTVEFKKGRAVIFPANYCHCAETPKEHRVRITAGMMYYVNTSANTGWVNQYYDSNGLRIITGETNG